MSDIRKIKSYIDDILGATSNLKEKLPSKKLQEQELFCNMLNNLQFVNARTIGMKHDFKINIMDYDDPFYIAIENFFQLHYTQEQRNLVNWWLYDKFLPSGEVLILTEKSTDKVIPSETPEDIWELIQQQALNEKKNNK